MTPPKRHAASCLLLALLLLLPWWAHAQTGAIAGKVVSADGKPAELVNVGLKGTASGTVTDGYGNFSLANLKPGRYTVQASFIGFAPLEQPVEVLAGETVSIRLALQETARQLDEIVVKGYVNYKNDVSNLATRTATPLLEVPQSIQVVPQQVLKDQQVFTLNEAVKNFAGIAQFSVYQDYTMRGFRVNDGNFAYNGVRGALYQFDLPGQFYNVEKIEAIKGPASSLFSNATPGGIINVVTKQPQLTPKYELRATYGTYNQFRLAGDATGPLSRDKKLLYRLVAGYENAGAVSEVQQINHLFLAPSLRYQFSDRTTASLELNLYHDRRTVGYERGILATQNADGSYQPDALPIRWTRHNRDDYSKTRGVSSQLRLSHRVGNAVALHALLRSVHSYQEQQDMTSNFNSLVVTGLDTLKNRYYQYFKQRPLYLYQGNLFADFGFKTGFVKHTVVVGADAGYSGRTYYYASWNAPDLYLYAPDYGEDYPVDRSEDNKNFGGETRESTRLLGAYVQDQLALGTKVKALLGLRYDTYQYQSAYRDDGTPGETSRDQSDAHVWLPRLGLVYQPLKEVALYGSYSEGFQPQYSNLPNAGGPFDPERGRQLEVGIKGELLQRKLVPTLALYHLRKRNILIPDPSDPEGNRQTDGGEALSKGVEMSVQGNLTDYLSVIANYTYNETRNERGGEFGAPENNWYPMAPNHLASAWVKYTFAAPVLEGLEAGAGFQHVGKRNTFTPGFVLPGYTTFDAALHYAFKGASLSLNVNNLTNLRHYTGGYGRGIFWAGMPRSFRLSLGYQF
jgi:iron complex outermembrane receptor protein